MAAFAQMQLWFFGQRSLKPNFGEEGPFGDVENSIAIFEMYVFQVKARRQNGQAQRWQNVRWAYLSLLAELAPSTNC